MRSHTKIQYQTIMAPGVYTARTIVDPNNPYIRVINTTNEPKRISKTIKHAEPLEDFHIYEADKIRNDAKRTEKLKNIVQNNVPNQYRKRINDLVEQYADVFAFPDDIIKNH